MFLVHTHSPLSPPRAADCTTGPDFYSSRPGEVTRSGFIHTNNPIEDADLTPESHQRDPAVSRASLRLTVTHASPMTAVMVIADTLDGFPAIQVSIERSWRAGALAAALRLLHATITMKPTGAVLTVAGLGPVTWTMLLTAMHQRAAEVGATVTEGLP